MSSGFEPARLKVETYPFGHGRLPTVKIVFQNQNSVKFEHCFPHPLVASCSLTPMQCDQIKIAKCL